MPTDLDVKGLDAAVRECARITAPEVSDEMFAAARDNGHRRYATTSDEVGRIIRAYLSALPQIDDAALLKFARAHDREEAAQRGEPDPWPKHGTTPTQEDVQFAQERLAAVRVGFAALYVVPPPCDGVGVKELIDEFADRTNRIRVYAQDIMDLQFTAPGGIADAMAIRDEVDASLATLWVLNDRIRSALAPVAAEPVGEVENNGGIRWFNPPIPIGTKLYAVPVPAAVETGTPFAETLNFYISDAEEGICRVPRDKLLEIQNELRTLSTPPSDAKTEDGRETEAARDVLAERRRQVEVEGWTPEHDDIHDRGEMLAAAIHYASATLGLPCGFEWPWAREWWKPTTPRRNLVKAGALILAEIERLDRLSSHSPNPTEAKEG